MFCQWPGKLAWQYGVLSISPGSTPVFSFVRLLPFSETNSFSFGSCQSLGFASSCFYFLSLIGSSAKQSVGSAWFRWSASPHWATIRRWVSCFRSVVRRVVCSVLGCDHVCVVCWVRAWLLLDNLSWLILHQVHAFLGLTLGGLGLTWEQMLQRRASLTCMAALACELLSGRFPKAEDCSARSGVWTQLWTSVIKWNPEMISSDSVHLDFVWPVTAELQCLFIWQYFCHEDSSYWVDSSCG